MRALCSDMAVLHGGDGLVEGGCVSGGHSGEDSGQRGRGEQVGKVRYRYPFSFPFIFIVEEKCR